MEKVNVYDWDKTIFPVDSTVAFVRWCLRRHPGVIWPLLRTLALLPGYWLGKISKTAVKEQMYGFLRRVPFCKVCTFSHVTRSMIGSWTLRKMARFSSGFSMRRFIL